MFEQQRREAELRRLARVKQSAPPEVSPLGPALVGFFKHDVQKRQKRFGAIAEKWDQLLPRPLGDHCALESFVSGTLTVLVDSSAHLYDLKQLLLAGLEKQVLYACRSSGLRKIALRAGRWYEEDKDGQRRARFE